MEQLLLATRNEGKLRECRAILANALTAAEDSGLEVDALQGAPGVQSTRWVPGTDEDRCQALLKQLQGVYADQRTAHYRACVALVDPVTLEAHTFFGTCSGTIGHEPVGENGFGYDPVFIHTETGKTGAQMTQEEKNAVSHRKRAWQQLVAHLARQ
jgi:XTP/dITP diphosphohydrolase